MGCCTRAWARRGLDWGPTEPAPGVPCFLFHSGSLDLELSLTATQTWRMSVFWKLEKWNQIKGKVLRTMYHVNAVSGKKKKNPSYLIHLWVLLKVNWRVLISFLKMIRAYGSLPVSSQSTNYVCRLKTTWLDDLLTHLLTVSHLKATCSSTGRVLRGNSQYQGIYREQE